MTALTDAIAARKAELAKTRSSDLVDVLVGERVTTLKFTEMDGIDWRRVVDQHPPRPGVPMDARYNYNTLEGPLAAAGLCGAEVLDGVDIPFKVDGSVEPPVDEWGDLVSVLSAADLTRIAATLWAVNENNPTLRLIAAKKALTAPAKPKRASRAKSASQ